MFWRVGKWPLFSHLLILGVCCAVFFFLWTRWVPLTEVDETRYTEATRTMIATGDYLMPSFNGAPRYQKPILYYWIQAGAVNLFGTNEAAARIPSAVAATLLVFLAYFMLARWLRRDEETAYQARAAALLGALVLASMPFVAVWGRAATTDISLTLAITASLVALWQAERHPGRPGWYVLAAACAGVAFLIKGPIGLAIPGLVWLVYHLMRRDLPVAAGQVPWGRALATFVLIAAPWYIATYVSRGPDFLKHFFMEENLQRAVGNPMEGHGADNLLLGLLTYWPLAILFCFPASPVIIRDAIFPFAGQHEPADSPRRQLRQFAWTWVLVVIGLFSLVRTQLPSYIQSIAFPVAILCALHVDSWYRGLLTAPPVSATARWRQRLANGGPAVFALVLLGLWTTGTVYALAQGAVRGPLGAWPFPAAEAKILEIMVVVIAVPVLGWGVVSTLRKRYAHVTMFAMLAWMLLFSVLLVGVMPIAIQSAYGPSAEVGRFLRQFDHRVPIYALYPNGSESLVYYARRPINIRPEEQGPIREETHVLLAREAKAIIVTNQSGFENLQGHGQATFIRRFGDVLVAEFRGASYQ